MFQRSLRRDRPRRVASAAVATVAFALVGFAASSARAQINFYVAANIDISGANDSVNAPAQYIGTNPSAVAWDGSTAYIGGYNSTGVVGSAGVIAVNVAGGTGALGAASFGNLATFPTGRGLTGLAVQGTTLAASADFGAGNGDSIRAFNTGSGSLLWRIGDAGAGNDTTRRGNGVAFDPGFNGAAAGAGVAYTSIGSGRRHLLDPATGQYRFGQNAGFIISASPATYRDITFDPVTGDAYSRETGTAGRLLKSVRTGDNTATGAVQIGPAVGAAGLDNINLDFVDAFNGSFTGNFLILNDRQAGNAQPAANVLKAFDTSGTALALNFFDASGANPFTFANSAGAYDFSWDQATQTLAMTDFANRRLYILSSQAAVAVPEPGTLGLLAVGLVGIGVGVRRRRKA